VILPPGFKNSALAKILLPFTCSIGELPMSSRVLSVSIGLTLTFSLKIYLPEHYYFGIIIGEIEAKDCCGFNTTAVFQDLIRAF